jgi:hypothetical protein
MSFQKYQHIERLGTTEVDGIEIGTCHVFPKIDGTNASVWIVDGVVHAGSRNRELSDESDNAGFYAWATKDPRILAVLTAHPDLRLFGEWLVPHSLKTYRDDAWRRFYVFDAMAPDGTYLPYEEYAALLADHGLDYIPPICTICNGEYDQFVSQLAKNVFMVQDGKGAGEGVVIKRYDFRNKFGRQTWAKIVTSEFKEKHAKEMGAPAHESRALVEQQIAETFVTTALVEKEHAKIVAESGWSSKRIPRLLNVVLYCIIKEDSWEFVKAHNFPTIDYRRLKHFAFARVKEIKPELF